jgi:hypothetical protein
MRFRGVLVQYIVNKARNELLINKERLILENVRSEVYPVLPQVR